MDIQSARSIYGMHKRAFNPIPFIAGGTRAIGGLGGEAATLLLALAAGTGIGTGWLAAEMTAHGKASEDTAKKEYDRERLNADIGYLGGRIREEANAKLDAQATKPARIIS